MDVLKISIVVVAGVSTELNMHPRRPWACVRGRHRAPLVSSARRVVFSAATGASPPGSTSLFLPRRLVGFSCAPVASSALLYIASRECWIGANAEHGRSFPFLIPKSVHGKP